MFALLVSGRASSLMSMIDGMERTSSTTGSTILLCERFCNEMFWSDVLLCAEEICSRADLSGRLDTCEILTFESVA